MDVTEAVITVYRYKHIEGSVPTKVADKARAFLQDEWGRSHDLRRDTSTRNEAVVEDARRRGALGEWPDVWLDGPGNVAAMTSHHYHLDARSMKAILDYAEAEGFTVRVEGHGSWKNAGHAVIVEFHRK